MSAPASDKVTEDRLQKYLSRAGISSRRHAEELIAGGRVRVDGRLVTELGTKVDSTRARVEVDGRLVVGQPFVYVVLHKPRGYVTTLRDPEGRPTVASLVTNLGLRVVPVGRLDFATSGVLLMTNDGDFLAKLQHPSQGAKKVYHVKVRGLVDERGLKRWRRSVDIQGHSTRPADVEVLQREEDKTWLEIAIHEGRNRQIRRLGEQAGHPVLRLIRVEYAGLTVSELRPGRWRHLTRQELLDLKQRFDVPHRIPRTIPTEPPTTRRAVASMAKRNNRARAAVARPTQYGAASAKQYRRPKGR
jgi:23S rRNA pseudouridine2605 synthase